MGFEDQGFRDLMEKMPEQETRGSGRMMLLLEKGALKVAEVATFSLDGV